MGATECCRSFGFTILTIITIGASAALFGVALYYIATKFSEVSNSLLIIVVIALCVSVLVFLFSLYASVKNSKPVRVILTFIYIIFALVVGAAAIFLFAFKGKLIDLIEVGVLEKNVSDLITSLETGFNCQMNHHNDTTSFKGSSCEEAVNAFYKAKLPPIGGCLIAVFVILVIGIGLSFKYICCSKDGINESSTTEPTKGAKSQLNNPLSYGW